MKEDFLLKREPIVGYYIIGYISNDSSHSIMSQVHIRTSKFPVTESRSLNFEHKTTLANLGIRQKTEKT